MLLFSGKNPADEFRKRKDHLERTLARAEEEWLADSEQVNDMIDREADASVPELDRAAARFHTTAKAGGQVEVSCTVPYKGRTEYLSWRVHGVESPQIDATFAEVQDTTSSPLGMQTVLILRHTFAVGTGAVQVKAWAAEQADLIEKNLDGLRPTVQEHADLMRELGEKLAAERLQALRSARELKEGLGGGI